MEARQDDIIRKIAALRRLAENAGTPEEAAAAAAKAQELLEAHNIAELQVAGWSADDLGAFINHEGIVIKQSWRQILMTGICYGGFVKCVRTRDNSKSGGGRPWNYRMVGRRENIEAAIEMLDWLTATLDRMAKVEYREYAIVAHSHGMNVETQSNWLHAFKVGAAETIQARLYKQRQDRERDAMKSQALIIINDQTDKALRKFYPVTGRIGQRGSASSYNARAAGREAGRGVALNRPANIGNNNRRIGG